MKKGAAVTNTEAKNKPTLRVKKWNFASNFVQKTKSAASQLEYSTLQRQLSEAKKGENCDKAWKLITGNI